MTRALLFLSFLAACDSSGRSGVGSGYDLSLLPGADFATSGGDGPASVGDGGQLGCAATALGCYTVYAHSNSELYRVDLSAKTLTDVGPFNAPKVLVGSTMKTDIITDLAVAPDNTIYVISGTSLYTASASDGHVTKVGSVTSCGQQAVALTFTVDGSLYAGDYKGAFCKIDLAATPPTVTQVATLSGGLALAGDLVAVDDGTMYGTVYNLSDSAHMGTQSSNLLAKIDPSNGMTTTLGATGYPELFGVSYALGKVFGFTHDGSGDVVTIDPMSGVGTLFNSFQDPSTNKGIAFAGAGVNAMVSTTIQ